VGVVLGVELDEEYRIHVLGNHLVDEGPELGRLLGEVQQHVVEYLDRCRVVLEDGRDVLHRGDEVRVAEQRHRLRRRNGFERDARLRDDGERPLGTDHESGEVDGPHPGLVDEPVEVVARDVPLQVGERLVDGVGVLEDAAGGLVEPGLAVPVWVRPGVQLVDADLPERRHRAVREDDFEFLDVRVRLPVLQGVRSRGVVADRPAEGGLVPPRGVGRELEPVRGQRCVEVAEPDAGAGDGLPGIGVDRPDGVHLLGEVEHDRLVDRLPGEGGPAAAG
jgi:hypothetical protein